jgi:hypothetical protein
MPKQFRRHWYRHIVDVIRSRHYTWLGRGLGGDPIDEAMVTITADVMHICKHEGIDIDTLIAKSRARFEQEERQTRPSVASDSSGSAAA